MYTYFIYKSQNQFLENHQKEKIIFYEKDLSLVILAKRFFLIKSKIF